MKIIFQMNTKAIFTLNPDPCQNLSTNIKISRTSILIHSENFPLSMSPKNIATITTISRFIQNEIPLDGKKSECHPHRPSKNRQCLKMRHL